MYITRLRPVKVNGFAVGSTDPICTQEVGAAGFVVALVATG